MFLSFLLSNVINSSVFCKFINLQESKKSCCTLTALD